MSDKKAIQTENAVALVKDLLSDKSIEAITLETRHIVLSVARNFPEKSTTFAVGFGADIDDDDIEDEDDEDDEGYENFVKKYIKWFD